MSNPGLSTKIVVLLITLLYMAGVDHAAAQQKAFKVLVVASADPDHDPMINRAKPFLEKIAAENHFLLDFTRDSRLINDENLNQYQVIVQLHLAPFDMSRSEQMAMQHFISRGKGWVGVHAAGLTGKQFLGPNTPYWQWFEKLMGGIVSVSYTHLTLPTILRV